MLLLSICCFVRLLCDLLPVQSYIVGCRLIWYLARDFVLFHVLLAPPPHTWQGKNKMCFGKGHPQMLRTVRLAKDGVRYQQVGSGEIMSTAVDGHFYYRVKPGTVRARDPHYDRGFYPRVHIRV